MDKESKSGGGPSPGGIIAIVMLTAGILFIREVPLETTRLPANEPRIQQSVAQDVDARLWQDPFGAVARAREEAQRRNGGAANDDAGRDPGKLAQDMTNEQARTGRPVEVLAVMLPGGPYSDNLETRRRARYAVLAGLNASGLAPMDAEHLAYFFPESKRAATPTEPAPAPAPESQLHGRLPEIVPFEWFEPTLEARPRPGDDKQPLVLLMWLNSDAMDKTPLASVYTLISMFQAVRPQPGWRVLGPGGSEGLRAMIQEARGKASGELIGNEYAKLAVRFYSATATAPDNHILGAREPAGGPFVSAVLAERHVQLVRTIGDDDRLAKALMDELALRGLHAGLAPSRSTCDWRDAEKAGPQHPSHVAVISEWDTLYGRTLRREFRATEDEVGFCVHPFAYVRGLDGQLLGTGNAEAGAPKANGGKPGAEGKDEGRRRDGTYVEIAEGQSQFDYLRRLALRMVERDRQIRKTSSDGKGLVAIGVLGSDVHDKLLVLQALQPEFPNAIFFTTDLDARFLHPREKAWTRNLIVGSNFGLRLSDRMQRTAPPFRDSYQTSTFLSTRLAMDDARRALLPRSSEVSAYAPPENFAPTSQALIASWFNAPRIFEIGRTEAFDFSPPRPTPPDAGGVDAPGSPLNKKAPAMLPAALRWNAGTAHAIPAGPAAGATDGRRPTCEGPLWDGCRGLHPEPSPLYPPLHLATVAFILFCLFLPLVAAPLLASRALRKRLLRYAGSRVARPLALRRRCWLALLVVSVLLGLPFLLAAFWAPFAGWLTEGGKPINGSEGISLWPTEAIRVLTLVLCVYLIFIGWTALAQNVDDIVLRLGLNRTRRQLVADQRKVELGLPTWQKVVNMFSMRFGRGSGDPNMEFWRRYIVQNRFSARAVRTVSYLLVALLVSGFLWMAMHDNGYVPQRGDVSMQVHRWLHYLMFAAIYFLVFFVVDATAFCVTFVRGLRLHHANWPSRTLSKFERELRIPRAYLDNWVDLQFIGQRTQCVTRLIYCPFIVLSLFLVSRSAAFDDWYMPLSGIMLALLGAAVMLACAVALRYAAEASRRFGMERLRNEITRVSSEARAATPEPTVAASPNATVPAAPSTPALLVPDPPKPVQLTQLLQRMENLREGAFAPFWEQPLLKAVLLPFATLGGTTLLDYLSLLNV